jgi:hypothetical protein
MQFLKSIQPLAIIFITLVLFFLTAKPYFNSWGLQFFVLMVINVLFYILSCTTYFMQVKAMQNKNPNVYFRTVMMAMLLKMFITITALLVCITQNKNAITKPTLFLTMLVYFIYLAAEVRMANKMNKQKNA